MAGSSQNDYDKLEDSFARLIKATVITADYELLYSDFPELEGQTDNEINEWLL